MACAQPKPAWHYYRGGRPTLKAPEPDELWAFRYVDLPCGSCLGCRTRMARDWSIRCLLEMQDPLPGVASHASWVTLTYDDDYLPRRPDRQPTLHKPDLSGYLKRLRSRIEPARVRFFATGEYGDRTQRPHYHAILYGVHRFNRHVLDAWPFGHAQAYDLTPQLIAYTAGYAQKKLSAAERSAEPSETVDAETGEVIPYQAPQRPFRLASLRPGIGSNARRHRSSWRRSAIWRGAEVPVPRYLHAAWKDTATSDELDQLRQEQADQPRLDFARREAGELIALARHSLQTQRRKLK